MLLTDGKIQLRPLEANDADSIYAAVAESLPEVGRWLPWCHSGYTRADTAGFIDFTTRAWTDRTQFQFGIFEAAEGKYLGSLGINHIVKPNRLANMGYWIRSSSTGQGIATAAVLLAARFAFSELNLGRLEIVCIPENTRSRRVAEKAGAKFEALARNRLVMQGRSYDAALYSLLPGDLGI